MNKLKVKIFKELHYYMGLSLYDYYQKKKKELEKNKIKFLYKLLSLKL